MTTRPSFVALLLGALASLGASYSTPNFVVEAPTAQIAQQIGQYAEQYRKEKALQWIGQEMPQWGRPCPLKVTVNNRGSSGATEFAFDNGSILSISMHIEGPLDRLIASVLPHEMTHTVFAYYFRQPLPRWADEGGSVLSEDDIERKRHDQIMVREILNTPGRAIPLRRLFGMMKYPPDVLVLYAEGYSVTDFLVSRSSRSVFLAFIAQGMRGDWDNAVRTHYRFNNCEELEGAWLKSLRDKRAAPQEQQGGGIALADARTGVGVQAVPTSRVTMRQTVLPPQLDEAPQTIVRGQMPAETPIRPIGNGSAGKPEFLPDYRPQPTQVQPTAFNTRPAPASEARLGAPQFEAPQATLGAPVMMPGYPK